MCKSIVISFIFLLLFKPDIIFSQENAPVTEFSDVQDTAEAVVDTFVLNHMPLSKKELQTFSASRSFSVYGEFIHGIIRKCDWYKIDAKPIPQLSFIIKRQNKEWLFYSFTALFFFIGIINALYSNYLTKLIRGYINEGFIFFQAKDQLSQYPMASLLMNIFFFLTATFFIFFGSAQRGVTLPGNRWELLLFIFLVLVIVYVFKLIFLSALGWVFNQQEVFRGYVFIVFLNNKIIGLILLLASFIMAFSAPEHASTIINLAVIVLLISFLFRFFKGFTLFSRQAKLSLFTFSLAVLSLEILPTAVLLKFISNRFLNILSANLI